jgi:hypothetical protein
MLLSEYQAALLQTIQSFVNAGWATEFEFEVDVRSRTVGFIKGKVRFQDGSSLHFREYVDVQPRIEKLSYSFHYQGTDENLIFRYDNAVHKPALAYEHHKHIGEEVIPANVPTLEAVLWEVVRNSLESKD